MCELADVRQSKRLLWNDRSVVAICAAAILVTVSILALQLAARAEVLEPESLPIFYRLFLFQDYPASFIYLAVLIAALTPRAQKIGADFAEKIGRNPGPVALVTLLFLAVGAICIYRGHPLAMDESVPVLQSKIFAAGELKGRYPPEFVDWLIFPDFQGYFIHVARDTGEIASSYWPGFALLLTPFTALGVPWLCNPVLGSLAVLAVHRLALVLTQSALVAGFSVLGTLASAAFVINAISFYSMTAHLLCNVVFVLLLLRPTPLRLWGAGSIGGLALTLHNPVPHILFCVPWIVALLAGKNRRLFPFLLVGYLPWISVVGIGWYLMLQHMSGANPGVVVGSPVGPVQQGLVSIMRLLTFPSADLLYARLIGLSKVWLWGSPALVLMAAVGFWRRRRDHRFVLLLASAALTVIGFLFVPLDQGHGWGFRYFHSAWFVLPILAATVFGARDGFISEGVASTGALGQYGAAAALGSILFLTPYFAWQVHAFIGQHLAQLPSTDHGKARVLIINPTLGYYAQDLAQNDPFLRSDVIRMVTRGRQKDARMMARYFPDLELLSSTYKGTVWGYSAPEQRGKISSTKQSVAASR